MQLLRAVLLCLLASTCLAEEDEPAPASLDELLQAIEAVVVEKEIPSVGLALVDETGPVWVGAFGQADLDSGRAATADTMYRIGSVSKMFVSLSVLLLVEEGMLSLDDRLADLAPEIAYENPWAETHPIRVVHLLEHTTGWDDLHLPEYAHNVTPPVTLREGLDFHPHSRISRWAPGSRMSYCNSGPPVAAYIVEKLAGMPFEDFVRENFFDPLGMQAASYFETADYEELGASLYTADGRQADYWNIIMRPSGSINASARDMARLLEFYIHRGEIDGERIIGEAALDRMESVASTSAAAAGQAGGYGLANYSSRHNAWSYREHNGGVIGGITELAYLPDAGRGHAIMLSNDDGSALGRISELVRDFETRDLEPPAGPAAVPLTDVHTRIAGLYEPINPRQEISRFLDRVLDIHRLSFEDGMLVRRPLLGGDPTRFYPVSENLYAHEESGVTLVAAVVDPLAGDVVHIGSRVLKPVAAALVYLQLGIAILWGVMIASSLLYFLVWSVRRLRKRIEPGATIRIRAWPLLAGVSTLIFVGAFAIGFADPFERLGRVSLYSATIFLATLAFAAFAVLGLVTAIRERATPMNRVNYWHSTIAAATHVVVMLYLAAFGIIGLMTWA